jgi:DNA repair protein RecN (Recombination protein N)
MLTSLSVQNFAIIDHLHLDFSKGFTVLTGETGAGKSLIIDAIGLILGARTQTSFVRNGEAKAMIEGVFDDVSEKTKKLEEEFGIEDEDGELIIRREIYATGKSTIRMNGVLVPLSQAELIGQTLADIHTQNDTKRLFEPKNYLSFIDDEISLKKLTEYQNALKEAKEKYSDYAQLKNELNNHQKDLDYLKYQQEELESAHLNANEEKDLEDELSLLTNYESIYSSLSQIKDLFDKNDLTSSLYQITDCLSNLFKYDLSYRSLQQSVQSAYYDLDDLDKQVTDKLSHLEFDEDRLNEIQTRLEELHDLENKYHATIPELIELNSSLNEQMERFNQKDYLLEDSYQKLEVAYRKTAKLSEELSELRKNNAKQLEKDITQTLKELHLEKVSLEIRVDYDSSITALEIDKFKLTGADEVNFYISFNVGEPRKELAKIASGGEMSRVMLALKTHLLNKLHLTTMIFDEIDSGISGVAADGVARKMKKISETTQVFAITHLPIVAAMADHQLYLTKESDDQMTSTKAEFLSRERRIEQIANMISPTDTTGKSKEVAQILLNQNLDDSNSK